MDGRLRNRTSNQLLELKMKRFLFAALAAFTSVAFGATTIPAGLIDFNAGEAQITNAVTPVTLFGETAGTSFMAGGAVHSTDNSSHAGKGHTAFNFGATAPGTGGIGPLNADYAATFSLLKQNANTTTQGGEMDTVYVVARNGGSNSDTTAILADVGQYGVGFNAFYEAAVSILDPNTSLPVKQIDVQSAVLDNRSNTYVGYVISGTKGALGTAYLAQSVAGASWSSLLSFNTGGTPHFDMPIVNGFPRIRLFDNTGAKTLRVDSGRFSLLGTDQSTELMTVDDPGIMVVNTSLSVPTISNTNLTSSGTINTGNLAVSGSASFTNSPVLPTPSTADNSTKGATTAYVQNQGYVTSSTAASTYAPKASPTFTGTPAAPTAAVGTNTTQLATTQFVNNSVQLAQTSYTPTLTAQSGSYTTASAVGSYIKIGGMVCFRAQVTITTPGTGTAPVIGLPQAASATGGQGNFVVYGRENSANGKMLVGSISPGSSTVTIFNYDNTAPNAAGSVIQISGCYS